MMMMIIIIIIIIIYTLQPKGQIAELSCECSSKTVQRYTMQKHWNIKTSTGRNTLNTMSVEMSWASECLCMFFSCDNVQMTVKIDEKRNDPQHEERVHQYSQSVVVSINYLCLSLSLSCRSTPLLSSSFFLLLPKVYVSNFFCHSAPCGLRGCKNGPAPFPGRMSYKATKPGLVCLSYLSMLYYCIVVY